MKISTTTKKFGRRKPYEQMIVSKAHWGKKNRIPCGQCEKLRTNQITYIIKSSKAQEPVAQCTFITCSIGGRIQQGGFIRCSLKQ